MNPDLPNDPHDELEARITALLLGELPEPEAAALRAAIEKDAALAALRDRLQVTIGLVREAIASPAPANEAAPAALRISEEKREKLLAAFKTVRFETTPAPTEKRSTIFSWQGIAAILALTLICAGLLLPSLAKSKAKAQRVSQLSLDRSKTLQLMEEDAQAPAEQELASRAERALNRAMKIELPAIDADERTEVRWFDTSVLNGPSEPRGRVVGGGMAGSGSTLNSPGSVAGNTLNFVESTSLDDLAAVAITPNRSAPPPPAAQPMPKMAAEEQADPRNSQSPGIRQPARNMATVTPTPGKNLDMLRRDLEQEEKLRDSIKLRMLQENVDQRIPKDSMVTILDFADEKPKAPTIMERFRGVERTARVEINRDGADVSPLMPAMRSADYDPYFVQTEQEKIKSQKVLDGVIEDLKLQDAWGAKVGGDSKLSKEETQARLKRMIEVRPTPNAPGLAEITVKSDRADEAGRIANSVVKSYLKLKEESDKKRTERGVEALEQELAKQEQKIAQTKRQLEADKPVPARKPAADAPIPQPEVQVAENAFSTFSLNVSDVSFKLAAASLEKGAMPEAAGIRTEEFINAFDYRDPAPAGSAAVGFAWERARYPFAHDRDVLRFSIKTAAMGREAGRPLNLVLMLDNSGSMERADRVRIIQECLRALAGQLQAQDRISVVAFARTARLAVDGLAGGSTAELLTRVGALTPEGGTNLEEAMRLAYQTASRHFMATGANRIVMLTDGAANLGDVQPDSLRKMVEENRRKGIALDCFGIGWEGLNDDLLEALSRNGDGRYGFVNTPEAAATEFATQLAGALQVAASDVKVQVEFNPRRTTVFRQIGYAKHQLTKEQFRDNTVDAAEIGAAEAGNALYVAQINPAGEGPIATVRARFKVPGTSDYREQEWTVPFEGASKPLAQSSAGMRLASAAAGFGEWLATSPYAAEISPDRLLSLLTTVPESFAGDPRPKQLQAMIRQAKSISGQ